MAILVAIVNQPWSLPAPTAGTWLALGGLALFGTAIAYIVFFEILTRAGASKVMLVTPLIPVTALLLGNLFLSQPFFAQELLGAGAIGLGLLFIDGAGFHAKWGVHYGCQFDRVLRRLQSPRPVQQAPRISGPRRY